MDQRQRQADEHADTECVGKSRSRLGQLLEFRKSIDTEEAIASNDGHETTARNEIQQIRGQNGQHIVDVKLTRREVSTCEDVVIANEQPVAEITCKGINRAIADDNRFAVPILDCTKISMR